MIIVIARAEFDPARIAELRPALDALMRATWEESGCLSSSMAIESEAEGVGIIVERWADAAAIEAHLASPHHKAFNETMADIIFNVDARVYDVTGERPLAL